MSVSAVLEDEQGNQISSWLPYPFDELGLNQPRPQNKNFRCLCFVDPYGNVVFNSLQIDDLRRELKHLTSLDISAEDKVLLAAIDALAVRCTGEMHTYLKFYGD